VAAGWLAGVSRAVGSLGAGGETAAACVSGTGSIGVPASDGAGGAENRDPSWLNVVGAGGVLLVHTSYRAVRPVEGGPAGLIDALCAALTPGGTLVMPSWSDDDDAPFDPARSPVARDLGVVAETFRRLPGVRWVEPNRRFILDPLLD